MSNNPAAAANRLRKSVDDAVDRLKSIDAASADKYPAPGKWSPKEILGHLIDSAVNNHRRFVVGQFKGDLVFDTYDQNNWVASQKYQQMQWHDIIELWTLYNHHIARVVEVADPKVMTKPVADHNLNRIAMKPFVADKPACLLDLVVDYVDHLDHHLRQIYEQTGK